MQVVSQCRFPVGRVVWIPRAGVFALTVVCKVTFRLAPDESPLAFDPEPLAERDVFRGPDESGSLAVATDLAPYKRSPEVLLVGHAYAAQGVPVGSLVARLAVAGLDKAIEITGDRTIGPDGQALPPERFTKMPLTWERAAGGPGTSNPAGVPMGDAARASANGRFPLPNLSPGGRTIRDRRDVVAPVGFGPIAPGWPSRAARLQRVSGDFKPGALASQPLPAGIDMAYFDAAPDDQHVRELLGTERIVLEGLHPRHAHLSTRLAAVAPRAMVDFGGGKTSELKLRCDTLLIDTDREIACLSFRGHVSIDHPDREGRVIVTAEIAPAKPAPKRGGTMLGTESLSAAVLPFGGPGEPPSASPSPPSALSAPFAGAASSPFPRPSAPSSVTAADQVASTLVLEAPAQSGATVTLSLSPQASPAAVLPFEVPEPEPAPDPSAPQAVDLERYPVEMCARISAKIALAPERKPKIVEAYELSERAWEALHRRWMDEMRRETKRGKMALLRAYDDAYVAQLEQERGPIAVNEYARLVVAAERASIAETLAELGLPERSALRIQRVWMERLRADADLRRAARSAIEAAADA